MSEKYRTDNINISIFFRLLLAYIYIFYCSKCSENYKDYIKNAVMKLNPKLFLAVCCNLLYMLGSLKIV